MSTSCVLRVRGLDALAGHLILAHFPASCMSCLKFPLRGMTALHAAVREAATISLPPGPAEEASAAPEAPHVLPQRAKAAHFGSSLQDPVTPRIPAQHSRPLLDCSLAAPDRPQPLPQPRSTRQRHSKKPLALAKPQQFEGVGSQARQSGDAVHSVHALLAQVQASLKQVQQQLQGARHRPGKVAATVQLSQPRLVSVPDLAGAVSVSVGGM